MKFCVIEDAELRAKDGHILGGHCVGVRGRSPHWTFEKFSKNIEKASNNVKFYQF